MKRGFQTKQPCVISSDALHLLAAAAGAMLLLPLEPHERERVEDAMAQAWKAMIVASGCPAYMLPMDWIAARAEEVH